MRKAFEKMEKFISHKSLLEKNKIFMQSRKNTWLSNLALSLPKWMGRLGKNCIHRESAILNY